MIHLGFENFVWLSSDEILAALHKKAPLFSGYIPESSPLVTDFDAILADALTAKGITQRSLTRPSSRLCWSRSASSNTAS